MVPWAAQPTRPRGRLSSSLSTPETHLLSDPPAGGPGGAPWADLLLTRTPSRPYPGPKSRCCPPRSGPAPDTPSEVIADTSPPFLWLMDLSLHSPPSAQQQPTWLTPASTPRPPQPPHGGRRGLCYWNLAILASLIHCLSHKAFAKPNPQDVCRYASRGTPACLGLGTMPGPTCC